jgi:hypothetical protein
MVGQEIACGEEEQRFGEERTHLRRRCDRVRGQQLCSASRRGGVSKPGEHHGRWPPEENAGAIALGQSVEVDQHVRLARGDRRGRLLNQAHRERGRGAGRGATRGEARVRGTREVSRCRPIQHAAGEAPCREAARARATRPSCAASRSARRRAVRPPPCGARRPAPRRGARHAP